MVTWKSSHHTTYIMGILFSFSQWHCNKCHNRIRQWTLKVNFYYYYLGTVQPEADTWCNQGTPHTPSSGPKFGSWLNYGVNSEFLLIQRLDWAQIWPYYMVVAYYMQSLNFIIIICQSSKVLEIHIYWHKMLYTGLAGGQI